MTIIQKKVTPKVIAANRTNSRRSTGPRTAVGKRRGSRNAGKYFVFGQITRQRMRELGEDPAEFERLRRSLWSAIGPRDGYEEILVEEMAVIRWRLPRLRRAEFGTMANQLDGVEVEFRGNLNLGIYPRQPFRIKYGGLPNSIQSRQKHRQNLYLLGLIRTVVENYGFSPDMQRLLSALYQMYSSDAGTNLNQLYERGMEVSSPES